MTRKQLLNKRIMTILSENDDYMTITELKKEMVLRKWALPKVIKHCGSNDNMRTMT
jgi:hypothetical protein